MSDRRFLDDDAGWVGWSGGHDDQVTWWNHEPIGEHHGGSGWHHDDHHSHFDFSFSLSFGWYDSACFDYGYVYGPWYTYWYWDCHPWPWRYCGTGWWYPRYRWYVPYYRPAYCYAPCDPFWWYTPVVYVTDVYHDDWYSRTTYVVEPEYPTLDEAWDLLAENRLFDALTAFARLTEVHPDDGLPRVGYAIAAGLTGDRPTSVYAMRRAFRDEPDALRYIPADDRLDDRLYELLEQFALEAQAGAGDLDGLFMLSAIRYLLGEEAVAHFAIEAAIREGDDSESAANLKALLDASLSDQLWEVVP